jgi:tape measure domain-containing protein
MSTVAELLVKIGADSSGLRKELAASQRQLKRAFGSEALGFSSNLASGIGLVSAALGGVGIASIKMAADMEQNRIAFTTMLGSASAAETMLSQLATFAEKTPFEFTGLVDSTRKLLAYGYSAQEIIPMLTGIGDAVAAVGGSAEVLDRVTLAFGQMKAKGFISGEEMRQLAEAGIPAWQMLANIIGKTIPETMQLAEDKALNADAAIAGMISQMSEKYGGMMEKQSGTITGILSNIKDKGGAIMRTLGDETVEALDLKARMQGALTFLDGFAANVKASGVRQAIADLIPPELELAIYAVAGAITAALIPSLYGLAVAALAATAPLWPLIAIGALVGTAFYAIVEGQKQLKDSSDALIASVDAECEGLSQEEAAALKAATGYNELAAAKRNAANVSAWEKGVQEHRRPGEGSFFDTGAANPGPIITGGTGKKEHDLSGRADSMSDRIEKEWAQATKTQLEQLNIQEKQQLDELEEVAKWDANYERDKLYIRETFAVKRRKVRQEEANEEIAVAEKIKNGYQDLQNSITAGSLKGSAKGLFDIDKDTMSRLESMRKYYLSIQTDFIGADNARKAQLIKNLDEASVKYQIEGDGRITFAQSIADQEAEIVKQAEDEKTKYHQTAADVRADIDAAMQANSFEQLKTALSAETLARLEAYNAQQSAMQLYYDNQIAMNKTTQEQMVDVLTKSRDSFQTFFSDILTGSETMLGALSNLFDSVWSNIVNSITAKWAANITNGLVNSLGLGTTDTTGSAAVVAGYGAQTAAATAYYAAKTTAAIASETAIAAAGTAASATLTAASAIEGAAVAAAWAPAASMVSLATMGANSIPAMAGITATTAMATAFSIPKLANGAITTGPSLAMIGEGRYQEAVIPLNDRSFSKISDGISSQGGGAAQQNSLTLNVSTIDTKSFRQWLNGGGGEEIQRFFNGQVTAFAGV